MRLRNIQFQKVWCGSGVLGFVGEGYWWTVLSGLDVHDPRLTFVTKTITVDAQAGNVPLQKNFRPKKLIPETLGIHFFTKSLTNKFALANPGLEAVLATGTLQALTQPFFISVGSVHKDSQGRISEYKKIVVRLSREEFSTPYGIQINFSCPNLENKSEISTEEKISIIKTFAALGVPVTIKLSPETAITEFLALEKVTELDAYVFSNTRKTKTGGLSGASLKSKNISKIQKLRDMGIKKPINAGGGILSQSDAQNYFSAGAESIFIWSVTILRPWRVKNILKGDW